MDILRIAILEELRYETAASIREDRSLSSAQLPQIKSANCISVRLLNST
jgi:hypothetical protein